MPEFTDPLRALYTNWAERLAADPQMPVQAMRDMQEAWHTVATEAADVSYETVDADGVPAIWCIPAGEDSERAIIYSHGGGFICGSTNSHRKLAGHIAKAVGARVLVTDYRRAPEYLYPAQVDDAVAAYRWLIAQGFAANRIVSAGDSAGGTIALALLVSLRDQDLPLPGAVFVLSPGLDWEGNWMTADATDVLAKKALIMSMGSIAFGGRSTRDPLCNPMYANLDGFPPIYLSVGGDENLLGAAREFEKTAVDAGVSVTVDVAHGRQHVFALAVGNDPEADRTVTDFAAWVRLHV